MNLPRLYHVSFCLLDTGDVFCYFRLCIANTQTEVASNCNVSDPH